MRLLNVYSLTFKEFTGNNIPRYIATSHRWSNDETTYQHVKERQNTDSVGYKKVEKFCEIARKENQSRKNESDGRCNWIWIDSCCIDKTSSAEVTESINSMFCWYKQAAYCIAYLADVRPLSAGKAAVTHDFWQSEWFRRGWTLQELLAPRCVLFATQSWEIFGHKCSSCTGSRDCPGCAESSNTVLNMEIAEITSIPENVLWDYNESKNLRPKAKWSWTEHRETTRPEDTAYCLLGIFDVYMPLIYGEGAGNASARLRQEIRKRNGLKSQATQPEWRKEWNAFSNEPLVKPSERHSRLARSSRKEQTQLESEIFDAESVNENMNGKLTSAQRAVAGRYLSEVDQAALAALNPSQIATAGKFLPVLDLKALKAAGPAQITAAGDSLPFWDLRILSKTSLGQISAAADAERMKLRLGRVNVR